MLANFLIFRSANKCIHSKQSTFFFSLFVMPQLRIVTIVYSLHLCSLCCHDCIFLLFNFGSGDWLIAQKAECPWAKMAVSRSCPSGSGEQLPLRKMGILRKSSHYGSKMLGFEHVHVHTTAFQVKKVMHSAFHNPCHLKAALGWRSSFNQTLLKQLISIFSFT